MEILVALANQGIEAAQEVLECFARVEQAAFEALRILERERLANQLSRGARDALEGIAEARAGHGIPNGPEEPAR
jgi:hypothetical protein